MAATPWRTLTDEGFATVVATAPGHVAEVRRLVVDLLATAQTQQLATIAQRIGECRRARRHLHQAVAIASPYGMRRRGPSRAREVRTTGGGFA
jgi:hypothetical protein